MGILKDWVQDNRDYRLKYQILNIINLKLWYRLWLFRRQRANRGWSDRDIWNMGEHIAQMTAEMLQHLKDEGSCDWEITFKIDLKNKKYKDLQSVIDDINSYLDFTKTSWGDDLDCKISGDGLELKATWFDKNGKEVSDKQIGSKIKKHRDTELKLYKDAANAMKFFGQNFSSFWD